MGCKGANRGVSADALQTSVTNTGPVKASKRGSKGTTPSTAGDPNFPMEQSSSPGGDDPKKAKGKAKQKVKPKPKTEAKKEDGLQASAADVGTTEIQPSQGDFMGLD